MHRFISTTKYLLFGLTLGLLLAPRSGIETRRLLRERGASWLQEGLNVAKGTQRPGQV